MAPEVNCNVCGNSFSRPQDLKRHQKAVHERGSQFKCEQCDIVFTRKDVMNRHQIAVHPADSQFKCPDCHKSFTRKDILNRHQLAIHSAGTSGTRSSAIPSTSYQCEQCLQLYSRRDNLMRHRQTHVQKTGDPQFKCEQCDTFFTRKNELNRHQIVVHPAGTSGTGVSATSRLSTSHKCDKCPQMFSRLDNLIRHRRTHPKDTVQCAHCDKKYYSKKQLNDHIHRGECHSDFHLEQSFSRFRRYESAFKCRLETYISFASDEEKDIISFLSGVRSEMKSLLEQHIIAKRAVKFNVVLVAEYENLVGDVKEFTHAVDNRPLLPSTDIDSEINQISEKISKMEEDTNLGGGSGWSLKRVKYIELRINKYDPLKASSYLPLPLFIQNKRAVINVQNHNDERCLFYAMLSKYLPQDTFQPTICRFNFIPSPYDFNDINFPSSLADAVRLQTQNPQISLNVYSFIEEDNRCTIYPLHMTKDEKPDHSDLLFYSDGIKGHWVWIKSLSRLVRSQVSGRREEKLFCKRCLTYVGHQGKRTAQEIMQRHKELCNIKPLAGIVLPEPHAAYVSFTNLKHQVPLPVCIIADLEAILRRIQGCRPSEDRPYTNAVQRHESESVGAYILVDDSMTDDIKHLYPRGLQLFEGPDCVRMFVQFLHNMATITAELYSQNRPLTWKDEEEWQNHFNHTLCYYCNQPLGEDRVVVDHCHITGRYRGAAHTRCNLDVKTPSFLPCLFHNLSGYDAHFMIRELGFDANEITVIPNTTEKYISFSKQMGHIKRGSVQEPFFLRFVDSYRLLPSSLDSLAKLLRPDQFRHTTKQFPNNYKLLTKKGVLPYEYLSSAAVLDETSLPPKEAFFSSLTGRHISDQDYARAQEVWTTFHCHTLRDYMNIYLKTDVLLLADIFHMFRQVCRSMYNLDPAYYLTAPSLSWDAMLKYTGVKLDLLTDYEMLIMVEACIRGGLTVCPLRYAKANNKYLSEHDPSRPSSFIVSLDANNLYSWGMSHPLPSGEFQWVEDADKITAETIKGIKDDDDGSFGMFLEVSMQYPNHLHDLHNDFPFLPETKSPPGGTHKKLMATLDDKEKYVVHFKLLQQALDHGLVLTKVHRAMQFRQSRWLAPYMDLNTSRRATATNDFEKDFFKLMNNSVFGKSMENVRKRINFRLVSNPDSLQRYINRPSFKDRVIFGENMVGVSLKREKIYFNRPIYVGAAILDISKILNYDLHYDVLLPIYGQDRLRLLYQDTDSLTYHIMTDDIYHDFRQILHLLDTSDYSPDHHSGLFNVTNKKVVGKWKDEVSGSLIVAFVGLRAKMYAYQILTDGQILTTKMRAKGVGRNTVDRDITFDDYLKVLRENIDLYHRQMSIRSKHHIVSTVEINKKSLSGQDDKRHILADGISTIAHGHYSLLLAANNSEDGMLDS